MAVDLSPFDISFHSGPARAWLDFMRQAIEGDGDTPRANAMAQRIVARLKLNQLFELRREGQCITLWPTTGAHALKLEVGTWSA